MRVLMLGWSFAPYVSGGVGVACLGLTRALVRQGVDVLFVLPQAPRVTSKDATTLIRTGRPSREAIALATAQDEVADAIAAAAPGPGEVSVKAVPNWLDNPYLEKAHAPRRFAMHRVDLPHAERDVQLNRFNQPVFPQPPQESVSGSFTLAHTQGGDSQSQGQSTLVDETPWFQYANTDVLYEHAMDYAARCLQLAREETFDMVHAHDWMSFPAGASVAADQRKPFIVQFHSTEVDRCGPGDAANSQVFEFERRGIRAADRVIAVSRHTAGVLQRHYGCPAEKLQVVYNGISVEPAPTPTVQGQSQDEAQMPSVVETLEKRCGDCRLILFAGRITLQKGSRFFVEAAAKVLQHRKDVIFVMAGGGDQKQTIREQAMREGIADRVILPGFLPSAQLTRLFRRADVFVMPSVSEPFGLAALEAMQADVPVIVSNTSGIAEVANHVLKVDFWDTDQIAGRILAVLNSPSLAQTMRENAVTELKQLTWDAAAQACLQQYQQLRSSC